MDFRYQIVGFFGAPVAENPTGVMVEAAFRDLGLRWRGERPSLPVLRAALAEAFRGTAPAAQPSPV